MKGQKQNKNLLQAAFFHPQCGLQHIMKELWNAVFGELNPKHNKYIKTIIACIIINIALEKYCTYSH